MGGSIGTGGGNGPREGREVEENERRRSEGDEGKMRLYGRRGVEKLRKAKLFIVPDRSSFMAENTNSTT